MDLWLGVLEGGAELVHTRVAVAGILQGFVRADDRAIICSPQPTGHDVALLEAHIRAGHRPPLLVYEIGLADFPPFACPDDMPALAAYRRLGFVDVPVGIMGATGASRHAMLASSAVRTPTGHHFHLVRASHGSAEMEWESLPRYSNVEETVVHLGERLAGMLERVRLFHRERANIHYHHMVAAAVVRCIRLLDSLAELLGRGRGDAAITLARSIYEIAIAFYVDWVAPELIGPAHSIAALASREDLDAALQSLHEERLAEGWSPAAAEAARRGQRQLSNLVSSIAGRARLSPLRAVHRDLYRTLSQVAHQDASAACSFAGYIADGVDPLEINLASLEHDAGIACSTAVAGISLLAQCVEAEFPCVEHPGTSAANGRAHG